MTRPPWETRPEWADEVLEWIGDELDARCIDVCGEITQPHIRPWSTVANVPTRLGVVYFKACTPALRYEPELTVLLARLEPELLPDVIATDARRGWILLGDAGTPLRNLIRPSRDFRHWLPVLPRFAALQMQTAALIDIMADIGVPDRRPEKLAAQVVELIADRDCLMIGEAEGMTAAEADALESEVEKTKAHCKALSDCAIAATIHHDDFHDGNVFVKGGRYIVTDWGEACLTFPFFSMLVLLRSVENSLEISEYDSSLDELIDTYLAPWQSRFGAGGRELRELFDLSRALTMANRAITWHRELASMDEETRGQYAHAVPAWLKEFVAYRRSAGRRSAGRQ